MQSLLLLEYKTMAQEMQKGKMPTLCRVPISGPRHADTDAQPDAEPNAFPDAEPNSEPDTIPNAFPDAEPNAFPDAEPNSEPDTIPNAFPNAEPNTIANACPHAQPNALSDAVPNAVSNASADSIAHPPCGPPRQRGKHLELVQQRRLHLPRHLWRRQLYRVHSVERRHLDFVQS